VDPPSGSLIKQASHSSGVITINAGPGMEEGAASCTTLDSAYKIGNKICFTSRMACTNAADLDDTSGGSSFSVSTSCFSE
jgi:hypothetical protein